MILRLRVSFYIAAFAPDREESVNALTKDPPPNAPVRQSCLRRMASCSSTRRIRRFIFRGRRPKKTTLFYGRLAGAVGVDALAELSATGLEVEAELVSHRNDDKIIPPPAQQFMSKRAGATVVE